MATLPPLRIVYWTHWFNGLMFGGKDESFTIDDCPPPEKSRINTTVPWCTISPEHTKVEDAAAVVFHAADFFPNTVPGRTDLQPWILETQESPVTAPFRTMEDRMEVFDYLASYHLRSAFLFSYYSPSIMDVVNRPLPKNFMQSKTGEAPILWIARNCGATSGRQNYVKELQKYIQVDTYGPCLNNKDFPEDKSREELMSQYKFYLAIENANCEDYVTEKLFDTLAHSAVPIVDGPDNYEAFVPTPHSYIRMDAFPDPRDLAEYIKYLDSNDTAYLEYLSFRRDALDKPARERLTPSFIGNWSDTDVHNERSSWCSVCRGVVPWWQARHGQLSQKQVKDLTNKDERFLLDDTCHAEGKWNYAANGPPYKPDWEASPHPDLALQQQSASPSSFSPSDYLPDMPIENAARLVWSLEVIFGFVFLGFIFMLLYRRGGFIKLRPGPFSPDPSPA